MSLRTRPYFPLYVQDYLTDEKLSCCTLSTQGIYIRILCVFHKSETYGGILFKQIPKQTYSSIQYFAFIISKQIGCCSSDVADAIEELLFFDVLKTKQINGIDFIYQKRMESDGNLSNIRAESAKKGGGNPSLKSKKEDLFIQNDKQIDKQTYKQIDKQNAEYEYVNEYEYDLKKGVQGEKNEKKSIDPTEVGIRYPTADDPVYQSLSMTTRLGIDKMPTAFEHYRLKCASTSTFRNRKEHWAAFTKWCMTWQEIEKANPKTQSSEKREDLMAIVNNF
jgi:hypothetical protein